MSQKLVQNADKDHYIDALRKELLYLIEHQLTPLALKYRYSDVPLESKIKWKPMVLILGNYSSGKSTLINEFIGAKVQQTGQAPTDDSFTVITGCTADDLGEDGGSLGTVLEQRDGKVLLRDPQYPFEMLRQHGEKFAAHFKFKKVYAPALQNLAIIDTPGMLDSIAEKDRGYDYQQVIGDLAQLADLVLVLFDPHKAGTIRETHASLRRTLPENTFEDRLIFVLNRIDECGNLDDLLRVYGTLCWNLSQMTGRKDIPRILLTYAPSAHSAAPTLSPEKAFLGFLDNQREELQQSICEAPRHRLDHLASFLEFHSFRLAHLLEAIYQYSRRKNGFYVKYSLLGLIVCLFVSALTAFYLNVVKPFDSVEGQVANVSGLALGGFVYIVWQIIMSRFLGTWFKKQTLNKLDDLTPLDSQSRLDSWSQIREPLAQYLEQDKKRLPSGLLRKEWDLVQKIYQKGAQEIRVAINELSALPRKARLAPQDEEKTS